MSPTLNDTHFDVVILGQGLAGTALAWSLKWLGVRVLVIDRGAEVTCSKIAAGLITPITGQKLIRTWRHLELWPVAVQFYQRIEAETGTRFLHQPEMVRLFADNVERENFERRRSTGQYEGLILKNGLDLPHDWFDVTQGGFQMSPCGRLDIRTYLRVSREMFSNQVSFVQSDLDVPREIELTDDGVRIPRLSVEANRVIFCQGFESITNPWFSEVELKPAKGEILTVRIPDLEEQRVIHCGVWLVPIGDDFFRVGATYDWKRLDCEPTPQGRRELEVKLRELIRLPFSVVGHDAAVRPIHKNQYPVVGVHPVHRQLGYLNGLGSKGSLHAPYFAQMFASHLVHKTPIELDVDLNRKTKWSKGWSGEGASEDSQTRFHVKRSERLPLTQQAQQIVQAVLRPGNFAIDATAGNGYDTQFLAELVGTDGTVFAFDLQAVALANTSRRLAEAGISNVELINENHDQLAAHIPSHLHGQIAAVMFNLGYLPGGDKTVTTQPNSTRPAIQQAASLLSPGGVMTIVAYTGHDGGAGEATIVEEVLRQLPVDEFDFEIIESQPGRSSGPRMFVVKRRE